MSNESNETGMNSVLVMTGSGEKESYINIKDLFFTVFKKAGIILVAAIVLGGALFGYKFAQRVKTANVLDTSMKLNGSETDVQYQMRVQNVHRARDLVDSIGRINAQIDNQRHYITDSVYMQIDSENQYEAMAQYVITIENNDTNGLDKALISAYERDIRAGEFLDDYAAKINTKSAYIKELIVFSSATADSAFVSIESGADRAGSMFIRVYGPSADFVDNVIALVVEEVEKVNTDLSSTVVPHKVTLVGIQSIVRVDAGTRDGQVNMTAKLETLQKQITNYNLALDDIAKELGVADKEDIISYFTTKTDIEDDEVPHGYSEVEVSAKSMIKPAVKYGVIGFAAGAFLAAAFIVIQYIFGKKISSQAQFFSMFTTVKKIGVVRPSYKRGAYVKALDIKSEDDSKMSDENIKKLICANYDNLTKDYKKVLITGTGDSKLLSSSVKSIGLKGDLKPDIFSNPDVLKSLSDYDGIVIVEQRKVSLYKDVANEISLLSNGNAKIVGAIIL